MIRKRPPRRWRPQWVPDRLRLRPEDEVHPHVVQERAGLFLSSDSGSTEIEVLNWLYATICLLKPGSILETGAWRGLGTLALAAACEANGFGTVHSVELDPEACGRLRKNLRDEGLAGYATVHCMDSLQFLRTTNLTFDFGFFDSACEIRPEEFRLIVKRRLFRGPAAFHDTSPNRTRTLAQYPDPVLHARYRQELRELARLPGVTGYFESTLSRGLFVLFYDIPASEVPAAECVESNGSRI